MISFSTEIIMSDQCKVKIKTALQNNDLTLAAKISLDYLNQLKKFHLNIAITGESGSGKSTLVNALRGIRNNTEGAAKTGATETTMKPTEYIHPQNKKIRIWDLPGIGTTNFTADKYLKYVGFEKYDFFIIVSSDRFRENDAKLAKEIQKMNKKFYFVRSKIDHNIQDEKECDPDFNEENLLKLIRDNCTKELQKLGFESPKVFLVSGVRLHLYEIKDLWKTLQEELPKLQRNALLLALPNISTDVIEQKKQTLETKIISFTVASVAGAAVPVPGVSDCFNLGIITAFTVHCAVSLGLTPKSLQKLSDVSGVSLRDLRAELKSPLAGVKITPALVLKVLSRSSTHTTTMKVGEVAMFVPIIGTVVAMGVSGSTTNK
uniref:IRG-type G domain-containing protein n=1 Tax=Neogobius melanostomus TaxID=47308 RepID=A0A8C6S8P1_9GOBI